MTYLSGAELARLVEQGELAIHGPDGESIQPDRWDITLRMGREAFISTDEDKRLLEPSQSITVRPGEFGLLLTEERIQLPPNVVGFISVKFDLKQRGLSNISGFHVDPGYNGHLLFSVYNAGTKDIIIQRGQKAFMMGLSRLEGSEPRDKAGIDSIASHHMMDIRGRRISVNQLDERLAKLEDEFSERREKMRTWRNRTLGAIGSVALVLLGVVLDRYLL